MKKLSRISEWTDLLPRNRKESNTKSWDDFWFGFADLIQKYFRVEFEGIENIPKKGPTLIIPNHSGYSGFDAIILAHLIHSQVGRAPRIMAHRAYFDWLTPIRMISLRFGLRRACVDEGVRILNNDKLLILFPEGESGNFKATTKKYQLQKFHSGFLRMAQATNATVVPCTIIGAEESFLNFGNIDLSQYFDRLLLPLPITWFPLPAKWKIKFLKPVDDIIAASPVNSSDFQHTTRTCETVRKVLQKEINKELKTRPYIYFRHF